MNETNKNSKIKIIQLEGNQITQKFEIDSASDYSSLNEEIERRIHVPYNIYKIKNKEFNKINKENFKENSKETKEFFLIKNKNMNQSYTSEIYENLNISNQHNLDEKTCCSICFQKLSEKPYYCYKCHKLYCDYCFKKLEIIKKKNAKNAGHTIYQEKKYAKIVIKIMKLNMQNATNAIF